jgi:endonuclease-3 related protein
MIQDIPIEELYKKLRNHFGFLDWWPGETPTEIFVGAILTQRNSWKNVEKAIKNMKKHNALNIKYISSCNEQALSKIIKSVGFSNQKAKYLKQIFADILKNYGSLENMFSLESEPLREKLLSMKGIGNETADSIILYAAGKRKFVIDTYTKRIMHRVYGIDENIKYEKLQTYFESNIKKDLRLYKDFHAQFVELGKNYCKTRPICNTCPLDLVCRKIGV